MTKQTIEQKFISKWRSSQDHTVPYSNDEQVQSSLLQAFEDYHSRKGQSEKPSTLRWFSAIAASLLVAFISWKFLAAGEVSNANNLLLTAIEQSNKLDADFEKLKDKEFNQFVYVQKFQLEAELDSINNRLAEAYLEQDNLQQKLQLWHQRNRTLSKLTTLMTNADNYQVTHI
ncbi:hypothetical protein [Kangiella aquimarina]|uniref:Anti-sigma factor n=1 Tax=Kangiella aquimarina TaxID=261965 RepID=A0ABZ0X225_9GAMM|nr:hypothetical protein [Kangiella aquimarina]WQG84613.1 hypothetical protein SR900_09055 [Kangiella aquimarina]